MELVGLLPAVVATQALSISDHSRAKEYLATSCKLVVRETILNDWTTPHVYMRTAVGFRHSVYTVLPGSPRGGSKHDPSLRYIAENTPAMKKRRHSDIWQRTPLLSNNALTQIYSREHPCYEKTPPLGYMAENTPAMKKRRHLDI